MSGLLRVNVKSVGFGVPAHWNKLGFIAKDNVIVAIDQ